MTTTTLLPRRRMSRQSRFTDPHEDRNRQIIAAMGAGGNPQELADRYGICKSRVYQIYAAAVKAAAQQEEA